MLRPYTSILTLVLIIVISQLSGLRAETTPPYSPWQQERYNNKTQPETSGKSPKEDQHKEKPNNTTAPLSTLEKSYAKRLTEKPKQFGYDLFAEQNHPSEQENTPMGAVQDDFVLGIGDELQITFTGQRTDQKTYKIDAHGMLVIKEFPPIPVMGRTIKQLRSAVNDHLSRLHNTQAYISLSSIRQIGVLVVGHVKHPGRKNLNAFHTILDALTQAGGVQKDGSLRQIKLVRAGQSTTIDLYTLLIKGTSNTDIRLKDNDRIIIPPIGPTLAVSGGVKRPGIYEIRKTAHSLAPHRNSKSERLDLNTVLEFAGGVLTPGKNRFIRLALTDDGHESVTQITDPSAPMFGNATILSVTRSHERRKGTIELVGHTRAPGLHDLLQNNTLKNLLQNEQSFGDDIYPLIGVIKRWDKEQLTTRFINFTPRFVLNNEFDLKMHSNDVVILFSNTYIQGLYEDKINDTLPSSDTTENDTNNYHEILNDPALKFFLKERSAFIRGAVRKPGLYPISQGVKLDNILAVAGGLTLEANRNNIEITSKNISTGKHKNRSGVTQRTTINLNTDGIDMIEISPGDAVRVNQKFRKMDDKTVLIIGEVLHPGKYDLLAGDTISNLIERAGGMTEQSYPAGAIFSRESERRTEELRFRAAAHDMERRLAAAIERKDDPPDTAQIEMVRDLADELAQIEAVGRITVETDPTILSARPELDMLLEKGDRIYIPKRPLTVRVSGDVLSPASLQFRKDKAPLDYIHEAGGFTYHADKDRTFVLYPDGSAQPLQVNTWNHRPIMVPPGSTIIVPRDPKPFDFIESAKEVGQILSNLAVTAVFIDDIRD